MNDCLRTVIVRIWLTISMAQSTIVLAVLGTRAEWPKWLTIVVIAVGLVINVEIGTMIEEHMENKA